MVRVIADVRCRVAKHVLLAGLIAIAMIFTLERDKGAFDAHPAPYIFGTFLMWGLLTHYHWTKYKREGNVSSRAFAFLWGLHVIVALGLVLVFGWHALFS